MYPRNYVKKNPEYSLLVTANQWSPGCSAVPVLRSVAYPLWGFRWGGQGMEHQL